MNPSLDSALSTEAPKIRKAVEADAAGIHQVIEQYRFESDGSGQLIPVDPSEIVNLIRTGAFYVAAMKGKIVGCSSIVEYEGLAELRSWAVLAKYQRQNLGTELANVAIEEAKARGHTQVYTLTQEVNFKLVEKLGFDSTERPPEKLARDCTQCPRYNKNCNETAFVMKLKP